MANLTNHHGFAFTSLHFSLSNKVLRVKITISRWENKLRRFVDCEPLDFRLKAPSFHRPCELEFKIESTADYFSNIISKKLLESFLLLKLTKEEWQSLIDVYQNYLERSLSGGKGYYTDPVQPESINSSSFSSLGRQGQFFSLGRQEKSYSCSNVERFSVGSMHMSTADQNLDKQNLTENKSLMHAFYHAVHPETSSYCSFSQSKICDQNFEEECVIKFQNYIKNVESCSCKIIDDCAVCKENWAPYVERHLRDKICSPTSCPLWRLCAKKQQYKFCKSNGPEGLILFSDDANRIGTVQTDYYGFSKSINYGGYRRVYEVVLESEQRKIALKEDVADKKIPKLDAEKFELIRCLNHENVIKIKECVLGKYEDGAQEAPCLFVMPFINKRGLNEQFTGNGSSVVDYLCKIPSLRDKILKNYIQIMIDVYEGLKYFADKSIIHGDIKRSNILMEQSCECPTVIECQCPSKCFTAKLADFDFIKSADLNLMKQGDLGIQWAKPLPYTPGGTLGMQAPETFFQNNRKKLLLTPKVDIWSASITMMYGFQGRVDKDDIALKMINEFCKDVSNGLHQCHEDCQEGIQMLEKLHDSIKSDDRQLQDVKNEMTEIIKKFTSVKENMISQCHFQSGRHPLGENSKKQMKVNSPIANIMTPVHIAHTMPQRCLKRLPDIFQSENSQRKAIEKVWEVIQRGLNFQPDDRQTASQVSSDLKRLIQYYDN